VRKTLSKIRGNGLPGSAVIDADLQKAVHDGLAIYQASLASQPIHSWHCPATARYERSRTSVLPLRACGEDCAVTYAHKVSFPKMMLIPLQEKLNRHSQAFPPITRCYEWIPRRKSSGSRSKLQKLVIFAKFYKQHMRFCDGFVATGLRIVFRGDMT
jgi:hypothetical protein